ncbi:endonuclease/exonuclease/phosphatase family protein [Pseudoblastomonas halimionae]|uniref:Endonuclease/exonuclease/phosphatase n=1 Tax=Alteriqipengyuania halimionae TaxID=1926630 RepID=A0A6I4U6S4_9SPHN|nr:endonuclease/exonuclease/phosphatase family protein [Alteriqipengyuania halimionae]MXP10563.1 endonuclease/exonuclease/phosphatase [Alteriqipengyuania halimionae]
MTFNIRLATDADGDNAWRHRKAIVAALIEHEAPDILGMQEVLLEQKDDLASALPGLAMVGVARDDGKEAGEFSPLAYRKDRFELRQSGTFWLSLTPGEPSKDWDAALPRIATWAILHDRESGQDIRALNTHFDHVGSEARAQGAGLIADWVATGPGAGLPTIVMGDFNSDPASEPYRRLVGHEAAGLTDTRETSVSPPYGPTGTFTGFDIMRNAAAPIDHIFATSDWTVTGHAVVTQHWGGRLPSDHYPVLVSLRLTLGPAVPASRR